MKTHRVPIVWLLVFKVTVILSCAAYAGSVNVTYDHRAILIDGKRRFLQSGSIHYPRSTPQMWPSLLDYAKKGGLDVVQTYVFWDSHEPQKGTYNFAERFDLVKFVKEAAAAGLYVNLRIGPYVCAEWNFGGFPAWLRFIPNIEFRTDNAPFKAEMERFVTYIVNLMKDNQLFASQGGPIILAQIENEYGNIAGDIGSAASTYIQWAADLAEDLGVEEPWIMCSETDAPGDIINTCNAYYCDAFTPNSPSKPKMWTENWVSWVQNWGSQKPHRPVEDIAFAVARFFARGGSYQNYYMYHGGTNFGRTAGEMMVTSYDYDAPLDEYGQPRQPKYGHLTELNAAIKLCEPALAIVDTDPFYMTMGNPNGSQEVHVYANGQGTTLSEILSSSTVCSAFISNLDISLSNATVQFGSQSYDLPPWSVSILPDCQNVVFNTAMVGTQTTVAKMVPNNNSLSSPGGSEAQSWTFYEEPAVGSWTPLSNYSGLQEQINVTLDSTDYLWYTTRECKGITTRGILTQITHPCAHSNYSVQGQPGGWTGNLVVTGVKDTLSVFVNGAYAGSPNQTFIAAFQQPIQLQQGTNTINVLSTTLGLQDYGARLEREAAGIGDVQLIGNSPNNGNLNLSSFPWQYQVGMQGENLNLFTVGGALNVSWQSGTLPTNKSLVWYQTMVDAPAGDNPVALDLRSMGKGQAWINGNSIGRFWTIPQTNLQGGTCSTDCDYRGSYSHFKCTLGCGEPSQRWYHVPREWLQPTTNFLVIFEEVGGDVSQVALVIQEIDYTQ